MTQQLLTQEGGVFTGNAKTIINDNFTDLYGGLLQVGNVFYCDAVNGSDSNSGESAALALATLSAAYNKCVTGKNDVVVLVGDGGTAATQRLSAAFTWSKSATHLIGISAPVLYSQRARIAPTSGATAYTPLFTISGNGCIFQNIQWFHGFTTGTTAQICMILTGSRNYFKNCHIAGMGDAESAADAGSRSLKIGSSGSGENLFDSCVIGVDTVTRSAANASIEFVAATVRNVFRNCILPLYTDDATALGLYGAAAGCLDRHQIFDGCMFLNAADSGSTTMTALVTLPASAGGFIILNNCISTGVTDLFSDATTAGQMYLGGGPPVAATSALGVNPA